MSLSTLSFGILLLLQVALAQSAPHLSYQDIDEEEALIDRLASYASSSASRGGGDAFDSPSKPIFADFDLPTIDYSSDVFSGGKGGGGLGNLQRKFAYGPSDIRFYLPASEFPSSLDYPQQQQLQQRMKIQKQRKFKSDLNLLNEDDGGQPQNDLASPQHQGRQHQEGGGEGGDSGNSLHYMKKSQPESISDGGGVNFRALSPAVIASQNEAASQRAKILSNNNESQSPYETHPYQNPNNIMTSSHDANVPNPVYMAENNSGISSFYYIAIIAACSAAIVVGVVVAGICWYRIHERVKAAADVDYPAYGVTGPSKDVSPNGGDRKLAQSAHMYHYQHQKQQMAALQKTTMQGDRQGSGSDVESEDDNEDGDYTVYECPGLAGLCNQTGEMEVKNPLYEDEPTPATPQVHPSVEDPEPASK